MPLQNRVTPFGDIIATPARGLFMGNRGGRIHDDARRLGRRRWASATWICCRLQFKDRHRAVWGESYTELFFLDEPTALAAGHRPCFECRRADAIAVRRRLGARRRAADSGGHGSRAASANGSPRRRKRLHVMGTRFLPDGAFVALADSPRAGLRRARRAAAAPGRPRAMPTRAGMTAVCSPVS